MESKLNRYQIWPYAKIAEDEWTIADEVISDIWVELVVSGRAKKLFFNGLVSDVIEFIEWLQNPQNSVIFVVNTINNEICLVSWVNGLSPPGNAWVHFTAIGKYHHKAAVTALEYWKGLKYQDNGKPLIWTLFGLTPSDNKATIKLMRLLGFTIVKPDIPNLVHKAYEEQITSGVLGFLDLRGEQKWEERVAAV